MPVLEVEHLFKSYGDVAAVRDISFSVNRGEIVGLLGPNGAGKTTTINMILGVLEPTAGGVSIGGINVSESRSEALAHTNFAAVYSSLPGNLTVEQNLEVFGRIYGVPMLRKRIGELLKQFDLEILGKVRAGVLSSGEQTRVSLAKAFINSPSLLLLDEPTSSLDPSTAQTVREIIMEHARANESGILWTSHNMYEITDVCDRVLFLSHGKILLEGDPKKLPQQHGKKDLEELFIAMAREPLSLKNES